MRQRGLLASLVFAGSLLALGSCTVIADVPPPVGMSCDPALERCDGACVDLETDDAHCGSCGTACLEHEE